MNSALKSILHSQKLKTQDKSFERLKNEFNVSNPISERNVSEKEINDISKYINKLSLN